MKNYSKPIIEEEIVLLNDLICESIMKIDIFNDGAGDEEEFVLR